MDYRTDRVERVLVQKNLRDKVSQIDVFDATKSDRPEIKFEDGSVIEVTRSEYRLTLVGQEQEKYTSVRKMVARLQVHFPAPETTEPTPAEATPATEPAQG